ncbi:tetratricopeptide repeat protein [Olivibacter sp. SDN3]|uniref:tetratricopeptide repeat protein n=1 Tax=Olivibacter sp. SDN3 TaxID=2764720 RepID=UPI0016512C7C|nr:tetratricopeptide repeat protein [Olivibacter sp. SDN3]QNL49111.1 tetratricopeptide repeat protein [Olivibacter sp. SDN3]
MNIRSNQFMNFGKMVKRLVVIGVFLFSVGTVAAQSQSSSSNPYVRLGNKAIMDGDFKAAVNALEKVKNPDTLVTYMLGYSQIRCAEYNKAINSFTKLLDQSPNNFSAYYWRGKARNTLAVQGDNKLNETERSKMLQGSIDDFSQAIQLNPDDLSYYQSRGMAYRDLGILQGTNSTAVYDKEQAAETYQKSIDDLQHVLNANAKREDLAKEIKKVKIYKGNLK